MRRTQVFSVLLLLAACQKGQLEVQHADRNAPPDAEAVKLFVSGAEQLKAGTPKALIRAREQLELAVAKSPGLWEAHYNLGLVFRKLGQLDSARASLAEAQRLAPDMPEPVLALAECEVARGAPNAALPLLENLLSRKSSQRAARIALAALYREQGELEKALKHARDVLLEDATDTRALVEVARVYRAQKELDVGALVLEKARLLHSEDPTVYNELGLLALERGDTQLAFTHFAQASSKDARFAPAHMNRGSVLLQAGDFRAAESAYRAALSADAAADDAQIGLAIALRGQGKHKEAKASYERVLSTSPNHLAALYDLAILHADFLEQPREAQGLFEKYLALSSDQDAYRATAQRYLEDLKMATGSTP